MSRLLVVVILLYCAVSTHCAVSSVICNGTLELDKTATFTCTVMGASLIKWGYKIGADFDGVVLFLTNDVDSISDYGLHMTLLAKDTLSSTITASVTFIASATLNDTYMLCDDNLLGTPDLSNGCKIMVTKGTYEPSTSHTTNDASHSTTIVTTTGNSTLLPQTTEAFSSNKTATSVAILMSTGTFPSSKTATNSVTFKPTAVISSAAPSSVLIKSSSSSLQAIVTTAPSPSQSFAGRTTAGYVMIVILTIVAVLPTIMC